MRAVQTHIAYLSIGSNLGDKIFNCRRALEELAADGTVRVQARSPLYRTEPVDYTAQDWFINQVVRVETELAPSALLDRLQEVQRRLGRTEPAVRFGPRLIDLDILLYDRLVLDGPRLSLPHPRMHRRRFVLKPLCDIDPELVHPVLGRDIRTLLAELGADRQEVVEYRCCD